MDDDFDYYEDDDFDEFFCLFGDECLALSFHHHQDECYNAEMAEEQERYYKDLERGERFRSIFGFYFYLKGLVSKTWNHFFPSSEEDSLPF